MTTHDALTSKRQRRVSAKWLQDHHDLPNVVAAAAEKQTNHFHAALTVLHQWIENWQDHLHNVLTKDDLKILLAHVVLSAPSVASIASTMLLIRVFLASSAQWVGTNQFGTPSVNPPPSEEDFTPFRLLYKSPSDNLKVDLFFNKPTIWAELRHRARSALGHLKSANPLLRLCTPSNGGLSRLEWDMTIFCQIRTTLAARDALEASESIPLPQLIGMRVLGILRQALVPSKRVLSVALRHFEDESNNSDEYSCALRFNLWLNKDDLALCRPFEVGPPLDSEEAAREFRSFWGEDAVVLKDVQGQGTALFVTWKEPHEFTEAPLADLEDNPLNSVPRQVVRYILSRHRAQIAGTPAGTPPLQVDFRLLPGFRLADHAPLDSREREHQKMFDDLRSQMSLLKFPRSKLRIQDIYPLSPVFRQMDVGCSVDSKAGDKRRTDGVLLVEGHKWPTDHGNPELWSRHRMLVLLQVRQQLSRKSPRLAERAPLVHCGGQWLEFAPFGSPQTVLRLYLKAPDMSLTASQRIRGTAQGLLREFANRSELVNSLDPWDVKHYKNLIARLDHHEYMMGGTSRHSGGVLAGSAKLLKLWAKAQCVSWKSCEEFWELLSIYVCDNASTPGASPVNTPDVGFWRTLYLLATHNWAANFLWVGVAEEPPVPAEQIARFKNSAAHIATLWDPFCLALEIPEVHEMQRISQLARSALRVGQNPALVAALPSIFKLNIREFVGVVALQSPTEILTQLDAFGDVAAKSVPKSLALLDATELILQKLKGGLPPSINLVRFSTTSPFPNFLALTKGDGTTIDKSVCLTTIRTQLGSLFRDLAWFPPVSPAEAQIARRFLGETKWAITHGSFDDS